MSIKILLADADPAVLDATSQALHREGFSVGTANDGVQALARWQADQPDLLVLEADLPGLSGLEICRRVRESGLTPVILLSTVNTDEQVVRGFRLGADDYVLKPFSPRELALRIRAVWRRVAELARVGELKPQGDVRVGDLVLDLETRQVRQGEGVIHLTPTEFRLLYLLASNAGRVVTASRLVEFAWGCDGGDLAVLRTHISHLRKKLRLPRGGPVSISVVPGVGYRLNR